MNVGAKTTRLSFLYQQLIDFCEQIEWARFGRAACVRSRTGTGYRREVPAQSVFDRCPSASQHYSAFSQKIFNITEAQTEAMIDPYGIADDFRRETVSVVTGSGALQEMSLSVGGPS
jgi:hypothetical protein